MTSALALESDLDSFRDHLAVRVAKRLSVLGAIVLPIVWWQIIHGPLLVRASVAFITLAIAGAAGAAFAPLSRGWRIAALEISLFAIVVPASLISGFAPATVGCAALSALLAAFLTRPRPALLITLASGAWFFVVGVLHSTLTSIFPPTPVLQDLALPINWVRTGVVLLGLSEAAIVAMVEQLRRLELLTIRRRELLQAAVGEEARRKSSMDEKARADAQRRQAQGLLTLGRLGGGFAHECSNRLQVVRGEIDWLATRTGETTPLVSQGVVEMGEAVEAAAAVIRRLLALSGTDVVRAGKPTDLTVFVRAVQRQLTTVEGLRVVVEDDKRLLALADVASLHGVLLNLALNARDAMGGGGALRIHTREATETERIESGCEAAIDVSDTGPGMDAATLARLFEPFFTTKGARGTGLGLHAARRVVEMAGGQLRVASSLGRGTTFTLLLPGCPPEAVVQEASVAPTQPEDGAPVLVVDDDPAVRRAWVRALTSHGFRVFEASHVDEAIAVVRKERVVLAWMDAIMPGRPTRELVDELRRLQPDAHLVVCSGYVEEELLRRDLLHGETDFVAKPCGVQVLLDRARAAATARGGWRSQL